MNVRPIFHAFMWEKIYGIITFTCGNINSLNIYLIIVVVFRQFKIKSDYIYTDDVKFVCVKLLWIRNYLKN